MAAEKSSGSASTASSSSSMGGLFGHYVPPTPQIQWERAGELLYFTGQWFDSKAVRHTYTAPSDVLYINPEDKIAVRTEKHQDIVTFSCDPCERDKYIVFTRGTGESRQIYYSVEPHPSLRSA
eukprot:828962_1